MGESILLSFNKNRTNDWGMRQRGLMDKRQKKNIQSEEKQQETNI